MIIGLNGALVAQQEAQLSVNDRGLLLGDGVFETLYYDGQALEEFAAHWQRLQRGLSLFEIPFHGTAPMLEAQILAILAANTLTHQTAFARLTITRGVGERGLAIPTHQFPTCLIQVGAYQRDVKSVTIDFSTHRHPGLSALSSVKHLGYQLQVLGRLEARNLAVDDVLFVNGAGEVVAATAANVFAFIEGVVVTPPLSSGCLPGIKRQQVIDRLSQQGQRVAERPLLPQDLFEKAESIFLTNSLIGVQSVRYLLGRHSPLTPYLWEYPAP